MRIVTVPGPVKIPLKKKVGDIVEDTEQLATFTEFLKACIDACRLFAKGEDNARTQDRLLKVIEAGPKDWTFRFDNEDFEKLRFAVKSVEWVTPAINRAYIPFYDAVQAATKEKPKK